MDTIDKLILQDGVGAAIVGLLSAFVGGALGFLASATATDMQHKFQASTYTFDYYREKQKLYRDKCRELETGLGTILGSLISLEVAVIGDVDEVNLHSKKISYDILSKSFNLILSPVEDIKYVQLILEELNLTNLKEYKELQKYTSLHRETFQELQYVKKIADEQNYNLIIQRFEQSQKIYSSLEICLEIIILTFHKKLFKKWLPQIYK